MKKYISTLFLLVCLATIASAQQIQVLQNNDQELPLKNLEQAKIAILRFPATDSNDYFTPMANNYMTIPCLKPEEYATQTGLTCYFVRIHPEGWEEARIFLQQHPQIQNRSILLFSFLPEGQEWKKLKVKAALCSHDNEIRNQEDLAQMIFGGKPLPGSNQPPIRLSYGSPQEVGVDSAYLYQTIDSILTTGIKLHAFPGCQILVAKDGKVILHKSYGFHTYNCINPVKNNDVYDLASVSKVVGATMALMKVTEEGKLKLDEPLSKHWKYFKGTDKEPLTLREFLAHQAGIPAGLPFVRLYMENGKIKDKSFRYTPNRKYNTEVYHHLYAHKKFRKEYYKAIANCKLGEKKYRYSDLSFLLYPAIIKNLTGSEYENFLRDNFYGPLGADHIMLNPLHQLPLSQIVPTEVDEYFRYSMVHGYVHDESAAMLGGISGNAGVFANANDMAKLFQMLLQGGEYGGKRYLNPQTIREFTRCQYPENDNRRGLGFDKPIFGNDILSLEDAYPAPSVSYDSYGHSGFTGTFFWVDPANNTIYILLTNAVYPYRRYNRLGKYNIRISVQQSIYDAIEQFNQKNK